MLPVDALAAERQLTAGRLAFAVGQEGVVVDRRRERALRQSQQDHEVEIETDPHADRSDEHALAEPPDPAEIGLQLDGQGAGEHVEIDRLFHCVERGETGRARARPARRPCARRLGHESRRPLPPSRPSSSVRAHAARSLQGCGDPAATRQLVDEVQHEQPQPAGSLRIAERLVGLPLRPLGIVRSEPGLRVELLGVRQEAAASHCSRPADHAGLAESRSQALTGRMAAAVEHRGSGEPCEHVLAAEPERRELEQLQQGAAGEARPRPGPPSLR